MYCELNKTQYECRSCWQEVTVAEHKKLLSWDTDKELHKRNFFKLFCILTGTEFKEFLNTPENEVTIWNAIKWVIETPFPDSELPKALEIGGKTIMIPELKHCSIGQNIVMRQIAENGKVFTDKDGKIVDYDCYAEAVAIYAQPLLYEAEFDYDKAMKLVEVINKMPAYKIRPIGFFLLNRAIGYGEKPTKNWLLTLINRITQRSRQRQGLQEQTYSTNGKTTGLSISMQSYTVLTLTSFSIRVLMPWLTL